MVRLPQAFHANLSVLNDWLCSLEGSRRQSPDPEDSVDLARHFRNLWEATGMDTTMGLARSTPDHRLFRSAVGRHLWESPLVRRCYEKPRGYAGDYLMMDAACNQPPKANSLIGHWMNAWFYHSFGPSIAARNRRDAMASVLAQEAQSGAKRILNVACGGVPELAAVCRTVRFKEIVLVDQDSEALAFATAALGAIAPGLDVATLNIPVQSVVRTPSVIGPAKYDVIYSMGLYDYLTQDRARKLTATLWDALAPGGLLAIANFQGHDWARYVLEAAMDWFLIYRDEEDLLDLVAHQAGVSEARVSVDSTGLIHMMLARKQ